MANLEQMLEKLHNIKTDIAIKESELSKTLKSINFKSIAAAKKNLPKLKKELKGLETERDRYVAEANDILKSIEGT